MKKTKKEQQAVIISYAQNGEDIILNRAFREVHNGFYIDVGANHPSHLSVTKLFYDRGWKGINIEPDKRCFAKLALGRPRDINLPFALGQSNGKEMLWLFSDTGLSTTSNEIANKHRDRGYKYTKTEVAVRTLQSVLDEHGISEANFLKIDVEGAEESVLRGVDLTRFRPHVIVFEATEPLASKRVDSGIRQLLERHSYRFVLFDGLNSFFLANEHDHLSSHFNCAANPLDFFITEEKYKLIYENALLLRQNRYLQAALLKKELGHILWGKIRKLKAKVFQAVKNTCLPLKGLEQTESGKALAIEALQRHREILARQPMLEFTNPATNSAQVSNWEGLEYPGFEGKMQQRLTSCLCTRAQLESSAFRYWLKLLGLEFKLTRKVWEFAFIMQALYERGALHSGNKGLGFAVGEEALPALFASIGCEVMATDLDPGDERAKVWADTAQLATSLEKLRRPNICPDDTFSKLVSYRHEDMNQISSDLRDFDFTWSSCSFEHCGSIQQGLEFMMNQMECLKPGGIAVHTTEFNLSSNDETVSDGTTVIFRQKDIEQLIASLKSCGHDVEAVDYSVGNTDEDRAVDIMPYTAVPHLKLLLYDKYISTSIALICRRSSSTLCC